MYQIFQSSKNSTDSAETTTVSPDNGTSPLIPGCNPIGTGVCSHTFYNLYK